MNPQVPNPTQPGAIGQYTILRTLTPERSFLAQGVGQPVVIKLLDHDCLVGGRLHPNIRDRLARVRELAHVGVANLHGVESDGERAFAVWEFIQGETLDRHAVRLDSPAALARLAREIILAVEAMHALGIVHGKIHARNVIVDHRGLVHLTHVSPLLYDDTKVDARDLSAMLQTIAAQRGWADSPMARISSQSLPLPQLRARLAQSADDVESASPAESAIEKTPRRLALLAVVLAILAAVALAFGLIRLSHRAAAQKPVPPQAPPQAFDSP